MFKGAYKFSLPNIDNFIYLIYLYLLDWYETNGNPTLPELENCASSRACLTRCRYGHFQERTETTPPHTNHALHTQTHPGIPGKQRKNPHWNQRHHLGTTR